MSKQNTLTLKTTKKLDTKVSKEQENLVTTSAKAVNSQTEAPKKSNKIVKPQLTAEELELKKQEQLVIDRKVKQYRTQIQALSALYPKCFTPNPKPLAIGLDKTIIVNEELKPEAERMSKTSIKKFLGFILANTSIYKAVL